jgi:hypothetical protein
MAFGLVTYQDSVRREDLLDIIGDVSPDDNPLSTLFANTTATQTLHEWLEDYLARPTTVSADTEGQATTYGDLTQPSRRNNVTQIISTTFRVSGTERAVNVAGMGDPYDYQAAKALRDWKNRFEYALINSTRASGSSGVARQMNGIVATVTSHYTARLSGSSLSETEFNAMVWDVANDVGTEDVFDLVITTLQLRQKISTFTAGNTKYIDATELKLVRPVMVYQSDFGVHRIFGHKDVPGNNSSATPGPYVIGLKEDKWRVAYLKDRTPKRVDLATDGDRQNGMIIGEATLEFLAQRANAARSGYAQTG